MWQGLADSLEGKEGESTREHYRNIMDNVRYCLANVACSLTNHLGECGIISSSPQVFSPFFCSVDHKDSLFDRDFAMQQSAQMLFQKSSQVFHFCPKTQKLLWCSLHTLSTPLCSCFMWKPVSSQYYRIFSTHATHL